MFRPQSDIVPTRNVPQDINDYNHSLSIFGARQLSHYERADIVTNMAASGGGHGLLMAGAVSPFIFRLSGISIQARCCIVAVAWAIGNAADFHAARQKTELKKRLAPADHPINWGAITPRWSGYYGRSEELEGRLEKALGLIPSYPNSNYGRPF